MKSSFKKKSINNIRKEIISKVSHTDKLAVWEALK